MDSIVKESFNCNRKLLKRDARGLEREERALENIKHMEPAARIRQDEAGRLKTKLAALKGAARLEDLQVKKGGTEKLEKT